MTIFVVIPVHNRKEVTRECLKNLFNQRNKNFTVIIVDDGSQDGTSEMVTTEFPEAVLLHGDGNLWWTGSMNVGLRYVMGICHSDDYILALNDDLSFSENYTETMAELAIQYKKTLIGSVIINNKDRDTIISGGIHQNPWNAKRVDLHVGKKRSSFQIGHITEVSLLTGRGVLIPISVFQNHGLYNDKHYKQYGDTELSQRAGRFGYQLIISYDAIVYSEPLKRNSILLSRGYRFSDFAGYFFNNRSNMNMRERFWFAYDTSTNVFQGTIYLICDLIRITFHFFKHLQLK